MTQVMLGRMYLGLQTLLVVTCCDVTVIPVLTLCLVLTSVVIPHRFRISRRRWYLLLASLTSAGYLIRTIFPHTTELDWILPANVVLTLIELLLVTQSLELFRARDHGDLPEYFPSWGLGVVILTYNQSVADAEKRLFLLISIGFVCIALLVFHLYRIEKPPRTKVIRSPNRKRVLTAVLLLASMLSWQAYEVAAITAHKVQTWMFDTDVVQHRSASPLAYQREPNLTSVTIAKQTQSDEIALHVFAKSRPNYLRGQVFDTWYQGKWGHHARIARIRSLPPLNTFQIDPALWPQQLGAPPRVRQIPVDAIVPDAIVPDALDPMSSNVGFVFDEFSSRGPWHEVAVQNDPKRGSILFAPLRFAYLRGAGIDHMQTRLEVDNHGIVVSGIDTIRDYTMYVAPKTSATLSPPDREIMTIPPLLPRSDEIPELALRIVGNKQTIADQLASIKAFFFENFEFSETVDETKTPIPLDEFLLNQRRGTCEHFASAAILLLRSIDIPCRYAIGMFVAERGQANDLWIARNRDIHAWVEVFNEHNQEWQVFDPSPDALAVRSPRRFAGPASDRGRRRDGPRNAQLPVAEQVWYWRVESWVRLLLTLPVLLPILLILWYMRHRAKQQSLDQTQWLRRVERQLGRMHLVRRPAETLHQFANRVRNHRCADEHRKPLELISSWIRLYAVSKYGGQMETLRPPPPIQVASASNTWRQIWG